MTSKIGEIKPPNQSKATLYYYKRDHFNKNDYTCMNSGLLAPTKIHQYLLVSSWLWELAAFASTSYKNWLEPCCGHPISLTRKITSDHNGSNSIPSPGIDGSNAVGTPQHCGLGTGSLTAELGLLQEHLPECGEDRANWDGVRSPRGPTQCSGHAPTPLPWLLRSGQFTAPVQQAWKMRWYHLFLSNMIWYCSNLVLSALAG